MVDDRDPRVLDLRNRLRVTGEVRPFWNTAGALFDEELVQAVKTFQFVHGLEADGIVGQQTSAAMNVGVETRVDQLRLSLERLRWIAQDLGDEFIAVNIAGFQLSYVKGRNIAWTTRVIVGSTYRKTPVFRSRSSGCIRVEDPFKLVELVLQEQQSFKPTDLKEILPSGRSQRIILDKPLPVLILYLTAALDASGKVRFYPDIYDRDADVLRLLDGPVSANAL